MIGNDISGQDFAGLLMGDVSGNWGQAGMRMSTFNAVAADSGISLEVSGVSNGLVSVSVYVEPSSAEPISAVELSLSLSGNYKQVSDPSRSRYPRCAPGMDRL